MLIRLQKYLAQCGVASRRASEALISKGKVQVNGKRVADMGVKIDPTKDKVFVRGKLLNPVEKGVIYFHKPKGVVSTLSDPEQRPCLKDFLTKNQKSYFPVGRLDFESTGLIILTNDGELAEHLMHPRYEFERIYQVKLPEPMSQQSSARLEKGIKLQDGVARAKVHHVTKKGPHTVVELGVTEGRNRMVRRMFQALGYSHIDLKRISHGPCRLGKLRPGEMRKITSQEYEKLKKSVLETNR